jgi:hypothetical protein
MISLILVSLLATYIPAADSVPGSSSFVFPPPGASGDEAPLVAFRIPDGDRIRIDGRLDEAVWGRAEPITDFTQRDPVEGGVPSERTEIRVLYDRDALYIGGAFYDSDPSGIIGHQRRRNAGLGSDDRFMWILDTFGDGRTGYFFETNPAGLLGDGILTPGSGAPLNKSWDGIWEVRTTIHDEGWTAEIRIPFTTLNFDPAVDAWGINFQRTIRRKNEEILWRGYRRNQALTRPIHAGRMVGIRDVSQGRGVEVRPFFTTSGDQGPAGGSGAPDTGADWRGSGKTGVDLTWSMTPSLRAALTLNTDFAEVEVDQRRVNLTRFPLRFPEQREFFLEGSGVFSFAPSSSPSPFFSRRIGLVAGEPIPIRAGTRLVGQVRRSEIGFYQLRTAHATLGDAAAPRGVPAEDFTVARLKQAFFRQSHVGVIYTRRAQSSDGWGTPDQHTIGFDGDFYTSSFLGRYNAQLEAFWVGHTDPAAGGWDALEDRTSRGVRVNFPNDVVRFHSSIREFGEAYDPAVGFVTRRGFRRTQPTLAFSPRPESIDWIRQLQFQFFFEYLTDLDNRLLTRTFQIKPLEIQFESGDRLSLDFERQFERLDRGFAVYQGAEGPIRIEPGDYEVSGWEMSINTAGRRRVFGTASLARGEFWSGDRTEMSGSVSTRPIPGLSLGTTVQRNAVELPQGSFTTHLARLSGEMEFSPLLSLAGNVQYDDVSEVAGLFARLRWIMRPGSDLYLVWTHNWRVEPLELEGPGPGPGLGPRDGSGAGRRLERISRGGAFKINYAFRL